MKLKYREGAAPRKSWEQDNENVQPMGGNKTLELPGEMRWLKQRTVIPLWRRSPRAEWETAGLRLLPRAAGLWGETATTG